MNKLYDKLHCKLPNVNHLIFVVSFSFVTLYLDANKTVNKMKWNELNISLHVFTHIQENLKMRFRKKNGSHHNEHLDIFKQSVYVNGTKSIQLIVKHLVNMKEICDTYFIHTICKQMAPKFQLKAA